MKKLSIALMVLASSFANAAEFSDMATVKRVTPRYIEVNNPISSCQTSTEAAPQKKKVLQEPLLVVSLEAYLEAE